MAPPARRVQFEPETEPQPRSDWPPASEDQARKSGRKRSVPLRLQTISYFSVLLEDKKEYVYRGKPVDVTLASIAARTFTSTEGQMPSHLEEIYKRHFCTASTRGLRKRKRALALNSAVKVAKWGYNSPGASGSGLDGASRRALIWKRTNYQLTSEEAKRGYVTVDMHFIC